MDGSLGEIIYSKAGRDCGRQFIITGIIDNDYVLISDGDYRRVEKAKKKKVKHIKFTGLVVESIKEKTENQVRIANAEIRKALNSHQGEMQNIEKSKT